jgi:hypothetical protein
MNVSFDNINKPTPARARNIGNAVVFAALAIQPILANATEQDLPHRTRFYLVLIVSFVAGFIKGYTMMLAENPQQPQ